MESTRFAFIGTAKGEKGISALGIGERLAGIHSTPIDILCSLTGTAGQQLLKLMDHFCQRRIQFQIFDAFRITHLSLRQFKSH